MLSSRDRHGRGIRSRLAYPNAYTGAPVPLRVRQRPEDFFADCVSDAVTQIQQACPQALAAMDIGIEDVPTIEPSWAPYQVPLAAALTATPTTNGQVVVYRRPLERRASTRRGLRILVYRTIVEQLASVTGYSVDEIDPDGHRDADD